MCVQAYDWLGPNTATYSSLWPKGSSSSRKKDSANRSIPVRVVGYSDSSKGYRLISMEPGKKAGRRLISSKVTFKHDSPPLSHGHTKQQDDMIVQAVDPDPRKSDDYLYAPVDSGIPLGLEDHELRERADETDNKVITYRNTTHHHISTNDSDESKISPPKRGKSEGMSSKEANRLLEEFLASEGTNKLIYAHYQKKPGDNHKVDQRGDYESYSRIKTPSTTRGKRIKGLEFKYGIRLGHVMFSTTNTDSALTAGTVNVDVNARGIN